MTSIRLLHNGAGGSGEICRGIYALCCRPVSPARWCSRTSSLFKFMSFLLFTAFYCYFSYLSMPSRSSLPQAPSSLSYEYQSDRQHFKNKTYYTTEPTINWDSLEAELQERKERLDNVCMSGIVPQMRPNAWEFVIDAKHSLIWCNVFKAASSTWMYNFNLLGGYPEPYLKISKKNPITLLRARFPRPTIHQLLTSLPHSLSFIIVRDPFHRLISAFRNKLENIRTPYYQKLAEIIVRDHRNKDSKSRGGPSFQEFIRYIAHTRTKPDEHWAPFYKFCTPCAVNFTVITKLETLTRDQRYIIKRQKLQSILTPKRLRIKNPSKGGLHTKDLLRKYYSKLDKQLLDQLVEIYEIDFQMFGYNYTKYYDMLKV